MHIPAPIEVYQAMHKAVLEVMEEDGGGEGLVLHLAYPTQAGFDLTEVWESKEDLVRNPRRRAPLKRSTLWPPAPVLR
jgi:hypothetical protein